MQKILWSYDPKDDFPSLKPCVWRGEVDAEARRLARKEHGFHVGANISAGKILTALLASKIIRTKK